ncbi:hypothetical protein BR93DRAFT_34350 [Coniochaeta sp. PMI_546]|nr:hypothetical protein BR93DRAFT_34350 [Coniochaeta sp. PMI_546]
MGEIKKSPGQSQAPKASDIPVTKPIQRDQLERDPALATTLGNSVQGPFVPRDRSAAPQTVRNPFTSPFPPPRGPSPFAPRGKAPVPVTSTNLISNPFAQERGPNLSEPRDKAPIPVAPTKPISNPFAQERRDKTPAPKGPSNMTSYPFGQKHVPSLSEPGKKSPAPKEPPNRVEKSDAQRDKIAALVKDKQALQKKLDKYETTLDTQNERFATLRDQQNQQTQRVKDLEDALTAANAAREMAWEERCRTSEELDWARGELARDKDVIEELRSRALRAETGSAELQARVKDLENQLKERKDEAREAADTLEYAMSLLKEMAKE